MKKIILAAIIATFTLTNSYSQKENKGFKGVWWGLASFNYSKTTDTDASFTILPAAGLFISPTVTVGAAIGYTNALGNTNTYIIKPLIRKYYGMSDKFFLFLEGNIPLLLNENFTGYGFNIEPGIDFFIGGSWTVEAKFGRFGYNTIKQENGSSTSTTSFGFNMFDAQTQEGLGTGITLGLKYIF